MSVERLWTGNTQESPIDGTRKQKPLMAGLLNSHGWHTLEQRGLSGAKVVETRSVQL